MAKNQSPRRLGGDFHLPVKRPRPTSIIESTWAELFGTVYKGGQVFETYRADSPIEVKRELFLLEVEKLEKEVAASHTRGVGVLGSLRRDVLPLYISEDYKGLRDALDDWQRAYHLQTVWEPPAWLQDSSFWETPEHPISELDLNRMRSAPWIKDQSCWVRAAGLTTLQRWCEPWHEPGKYRGRDLEWQTKLGEQTAQSDHNTIKLHYDPCTSNRAEVEAEFNRILDERDKTVMEQGAVRTKELRQPKQFEWLARSQILNQCDDEILRQTPERDVTDDSIRKSGERLTKEIGLVPRART